MLANRARRLNILGIKAVLTRPRPGVTANTFGIKDFLRRRRHLVYGRQACIRRIGVAARLNGLYFC